MFTTEKQRLVCNKYQVQVHQVLAGDGVMVFFPDQRWRLVSPFYKYDVFCV